MNLGKPFDAGSVQEVRYSNSSSFACHWYVIAYAKLKDWKPQAMPSCLCSWPCLLCVEVRKVGSASLVVGAILKEFRAKDWSFIPTPSRVVCLQ